MFELDDEGTRPPIRLPKELLLFVYKFLDDRDRVALALSGAFAGFASLYDAERRGATNISISYRHHFLSNRSHWERFLSQNSHFPSAITVFDVTNCYWLPAQQICGAVAQLANLQQLSVNGTKVGLANLAPIFTACKKITHLDFKFVEKSWGEVLSAVGGQAKVDVITGGFKKLTSVKISTWWLNARDFLNDPWLLIIRFLSWCRDCIGLTVEISYMGHPFKREPLLALNSAEKEVQRMVKNDLFPKLEWMINLKKFVLIKYGTFYNRPDYLPSVQSLLLDDLCALIFREERAPSSSLESVFVQDFFLATSLLPHWRNSPLKKTYYDTIHELDLSNDGDYQILLQHGDGIEHLGGIEHFPSHNQRIAHPGPYLPNLKYCCATGFASRQNQDYFFNEHPNLEQLLTEGMDNYVPSVDLRLPKLKLLSVNWDFATLSRERIEILTSCCPNIETFRLVFNPRLYGNTQSGALTLSAISFKKLTSLSIYGEFQLNDGAFLLSVIRECPQLRKFQLEGNFNNSFIPNLDQFLKSASNLRDLGKLLKNCRLQLFSSRNDYVGDSLLLLLLKTILQACPDLERLTLSGVMMYGAGTPPCSSITPFGLEDDLVKFAKNNKRLMFFCIKFYNLNAAVSDQINRIIAEKVVRFRPSLWFSVGNDLPKDDPNLPLIHYLEMIEGYNPPPMF